ncbi:hypothetical protein [Streptomyces sp. NPDC059743]|uniref:hypothetical protein n=1 Tax=Streptomyces sp. NPDC059743 TaxID=3346928 RepID=UPI00365E0512
MGYLFLETRPADGEREPGWTEGLKTAQPPLCLSHAVASAEHCGHLVKTGHVALLAESAPLYGVLGIRYQISVGGRRGLEGDEVPILYGHPQAQWFLAPQLVRTLRRVRVVELGDLVSQATSQTTARRSGCFGPAL